MRLDRTVPFGQVIGLNGVNWTQHDHFFRHDGKEVKLIDRPITPQARQRMIEEGAEPESIPATETVCVGLADETEADDELPNEGDLKGMHWKTLKAMAETYGYEWTDKETAIRDLTSHK